MKDTPVTTDTEISFTDMNGDRRVYNRPAHCGACARCLLHETMDLCTCGGPFDEHMTRSAAQLVIL